jgi:hypothetical protein
MENLNKKLKISNYFNEFSFQETNDDRIKLLMEVILKFNLKGKKFALCVDSFVQQSVFFLNCCDGSGVIPISVEQKTSEMINSVYYMGLIEKYLDIDVIALITDRAPKIIQDQELFQILDEINLKVIDKNVKIYKDPYNLYKSLMKLVINGKTEINKNLLTMFFEKIKDFETLNAKTYKNSFK